MVTGAAMEPRICNQAFLGFLQFSSLFVLMLVFFTVEAGFFFLFLLLLFCFFFLEICVLGGIFKIVNFEGSF